MRDPKDTKRSIFRDEAVRRYIESQEKSVLPRIVSPQTFLYLWSLLGLLAASSIITWFAKIPVYASGPAVVTRWHKAEGRSEELVVVAFLPPQYITKLRTNQKLFLKFDGIGDRGAFPQGNRFSRTILVIEPQLRSPDSVQKQFALSPSVAQAITQPVAVVIARWLRPPLASQPPTQLPAAVYLGSLGRAEVEIDSQRAISLLPIIGQFAQDVLPKSFK